MALALLLSVQPVLEEEMAKLERCELLVWHFPLWWFSVPAILKGWADKVSNRNVALEILYYDGAES